MCLIFTSPENKEATSLNEVLPQHTRPHPPRTPAGGLLVQTQGLALPPSPTPAGTQGHKEPETWGPESAALTLPPTPTRPQTRNLTVRGPPFLISLPCRAVLRIQCSPGNPALGTVRNLPPPGQILALLLLKWQHAAVSQEALGACGKCRPLPTVPPERWPGFESGSPLNNQRKGLGFVTSSAEYN